MFVLRRTKRIGMKSRKLEEQALLAKLSSEQVFKKLIQSVKQQNGVHVGIMKLIIKSRQLIIELQQPF